MRDATSEAAFFQTYGNVFSLYLADKHEADEHAAEGVAEPRDLPFVKEALAAIAEGGYAEALARVGVLLARAGRAAAAGAACAQAGADRRVPRTSSRHCRPTSGGASAASRTSSSATSRRRRVATLPELLAEPGDRERLLTLVRRLLADERVRRIEPTTEQLAMLASIGETLDVAPVRGRGTARPRRRRASPRRRRASGA